MYPAVRAPARLSVASEAWKLIFEFFMASKPHWDELAAGFDLSASQGDALLRLQPGAPMPMSQLAGQLHCDASNVTGIVDRLESRRLVERRPDEHDRRVKMIALTAKGEQLRAQVHERLFTPPPPLTALSAADQRALRDILRRAFASPG